MPRSALDAPNGRLPNCKGIQIAQQLCAGLAAAGEQGAIEKWRGLCCLAGAAVGLALVCWLAQPTYLVNQVGLARHPESLTDTAREMIEKLGYTNKPAMQARGFLSEGKDILHFRYGFNNKAKDTIRFWYRQSPIATIAAYYCNGWGEESFTRIAAGTHVELCRPMSTYVDPIFAHATPQRHMRLLQTVLAALAATFVAWPSRHATRNTRHAARPLVASNRAKSN